MSGYHLSTRYKCHSSLARRQRYLPSRIRCTLWEIKLASLLTRCLTRCTALADLNSHLSIPHSVSLSLSFGSLMLRAIGKAEQWLTYKSSITWFFLTLTPYPSSQRSSPTSKDIPNLLFWILLLSFINGSFIQTTVLYLLLSLIMVKRPFKFRSWDISARWPMSNKR